MKTKYLITMIFCLGIFMAQAQISDIKNPFKKGNDDAAKREAALARINAQFEGRPTSPGADIATDKENPPVKKEKFTDKLIRYKNEGFKVAVVLKTHAGKLKNPSADEISRPLSVFGVLPVKREDYLPSFESFTKQLGEAFATDLFEIVDMSKIPYQEAGGLKFDNWEGSIYKMVLTYEVNSDYTYRLIAGEWKATYHAYINVSIFELVNEKKGIKTRWPVRQANLASYFGKTYESSKNPEFTTLEEVQDAIGHLKGAELATKLANEQEGQIVKFIEKRKKK